VRVRGPWADTLAASHGARLRVAAPGEVIEQPAFNVVGILPGRGTPERPELAEQAIVLSAHYDHIGVREGAPEGEDAVYNGADDDASGCAAVLELAEALAAGPAPARTVVFLLATGEEIGLVGTRHYLEQPAVPLERTVTNLNFEMIGRPDALVGGRGKLWLTGWERTNLGPAFAARGLGVVPDARPEQAFFQRSDNYAFAVRGIVAQTLSSYDLHSDYHRVSDEASKLDWLHMQEAVRSSLAAVRALADGSIDPAWEPGGSPAR
jgi:Zn-dependent M28 family amino/carboxypeptidase